MDDPDDRELREQGVRALMTRRALPGKLVWIGLRTSRGAPMHRVDDAELCADHGVLGDYASARAGGKRQVTLLQAEHLPVIAALAGRSEVAPELLRRNLVVANFNVLALRARRFRVGNALLEGTGTCDPCSKMELALGRGGYNAVRGHGGITARVLEGALVHVGDAVDFSDD